MSSQILSQTIEGFHHPSYYAGITCAFAEVVAMGCKQLALSSPYSDDELAVMLEPTRITAQAYGLPIYLERDLLITQLFDVAIAQGKTVVLIAQNQTVIDTYLSLKQLRAEASAVHRLTEIEAELAWRFGRLLSYSDAMIRQLLSRQK
jgi:hypothetical protein